MARSTAGIGTPPNTDVHTYASKGSLHRDPHGHGHRRCHRPRHVETITVTNTAPTASLAAAPTTGPRNLAVTFDGSGSTDADGQADLALYEIEFGDGTPNATGTGVAAGEPRAHVRGQGHLHREAHRQGRRRRHRQRNEDHHGHEHGPDGRPERRAADRYHRPAGHVRHGHHRPTPTAQPTSSRTSSTSVTAAPVGDGPPVQRRSLRLTCTPGTQGRARSSDASGAKLHAVTITDDTAGASEATARQVRHDLTVTSAQHDLPVRPTAAHRTTANAAAVRAPLPVTFSTAGTTPIPTAPRTS